MKFIGENGIALEGNQMTYRDYARVWYVGALVIIAFSMGRVEMMNTFFPCGIALISVALKRNTLNLYILPPIVIGLLTFWTRNGFIWGDLAAAVVCGIVFMILFRRKLTDFHRMTICCAVTVIANGVYYLSANMAYRMDLKLLLFEVVIICGLYYIFHVFFSFANIKEDYKGSVEGGIVALSGVWCLTFCGLFMWDSAGAAAYIPLGAGFFCILLLGYKLGISAGIIAGTAAGIIFYLCEIMPVSQLIIFTAAGLTAGFFRGLNKYTSALCFAAVCMVFNLAGSGAMAEVPPLLPLAAAIAFMLIPRPLERSMNGIFKRLTGERSAAADIRTEELVNVLSGYKQCFGALAKLYSMEKNSRSIISYQFRGMEQVVNQLELDIREANKGKLACISVNTEKKYNIEVGTSGYARSGGVSGDSYICRELSDGRYIIVLSDGMGKGEAAAVESNLAVRTLANLIEAGFQVELALRTLNSILLLKSEEEIFSTVDIGIFDKNSGRLKLYKVGAATTFIKRGNRVDTVKMAALPMGIVDGLRIDFVNIRLHQGDQIIMVSDGIIDSKRHTANEGGEGDWVAGMISAVKSKDPHTMADLIINKAVENYGIREKDDLTVISAVIRGNI